MKFWPALSNENYRQRIVSTNNRWEMGFRPQLYHWDIVVGQVGADGYSLIYSAGENWPKAVAVFTTVQSIMEKYPTNVTEKQLRADFPEQKIKPVWNDPDVWLQLQLMARQPVA